MPEHGGGNITAPNQTTEVRPAQPEHALASRMRRPCFVSCKKHQRTPLSLMLALQAVTLLLEYCLSDLELGKPEACKQLLGLPLCLLADETLHIFRAASQPSLNICTADQASLLTLRTKHLVLHHQACPLLCRHPLSIDDQGQGGLCDRGTPGTLAYIFATCVLYAWPHAWPIACHTCYTCSPRSPA